jgi:RNA-directed DNA polymerase
LYLDIKGYCPSVDHEILLSLLIPKIRERPVQTLLERLLISGWHLYQQDQVRHFLKLQPVNGQTRPCGLPIGNVTSQWWGNLYLNDLDHFIKRTLKVPAYLRYMDDLVCFGTDRTFLKHCRSEIRDWLAHHRRLRVNDHKAFILPARVKRVWLGYRVSREGYDLGPKAIRRFRRKLSANTDIAMLRRQLTAWKGAMLT